MIETFKARLGRVLLHPAAVFAGLIGGGIVGWLDQGQMPLFELLGEIYSQALEAKGVTVTRKFNIGAREAYLKALQDGSTSLLPEYNGALLSALTPGGAPEGVISAAALRCVGGELQGRLRFRNDEERARAKRMGVKGEDTIYLTEDLAKGDVMFAATGVTKGALLDGVVVRGGEVRTHTLVMNSATGEVREIRMTRRVA